MPENLKKKEEKKMKLKKWIEHKDMYLVFEKRTAKKIPIQILTEIAKIGNYSIKCQYDHTYWIMVTNVIDWIPSYL